MRYIDRSKLSRPDLLGSTRVEAAEATMVAFISRTEKKGGTRRVPSSEWLTLDDTFRRQMFEAFGGTCAYCERATAAERSRPDSGIATRHRPESLAQDEDGSTEFLAYAWLAFAWENFLWVCADCARRKGNRFYVEGVRGAPFTAIEALRVSENALFLDPTFDAPSVHLSFGINGQVSSRTPRGRAMVEVLRLGSPELTDLRRQAVLALIDAFEAHTPVVLFRTGASVPEDAAILYVQSTSAPEQVVPAHSGAASRALAVFARTVTDFENLEAFHGAFESWDGDAQRRFCAEARNAATQEGTALSHIEAGADIKVTGIASAPRVPDVHDLPTATSPLSRVEIWNFKALRDISFDLPATVEDPEQTPCMILLGENATGKSSVLQAMALAMIGAEEAHALDDIVREEGLAPAELIHRRDPSQWDRPEGEMRIRLRFLDADASVLLHAEAGAEAFAGSPKCVKVVLGYGPRRYFTNRRTRRLRAPAERVRSLFDPLDMIANPIHWLAGLKEEQFNAAARALRVILMLDAEDDFERTEADGGPRQVFIRQKGQRTALGDLSVGYKSVIALGCDVTRELLYHFDNLEFAHAIVFVDEIEAHLHPRWKMQIMQLMRQAFPRVQFVVTTHDPLCLRGMYDGEVFVLERGGRDARVQKVTDLPSIRGMRAEQILTSEFFGLGSTDPETDAMLARYNALAARIEGLTEIERMEMERLSLALDQNLVIGTSLAEQAYAEALKEQTRDEVVLTPTRSPRRQILKARFSSLFDGPGSR